MDEALRLSLQVIVSLLIIFGVLWWVWRLPAKPTTESSAAPVLAFGSVWFGLAALAVDGWLWFTPNPDAWVVVETLLYAGTLTTGYLAVWIYRGTPETMRSDEVQMQRLQAQVGLTLGIFAVIFWYLFILVHKPILTPIGG